MTSQQITLGLTAIEAAAELGVSLPTLYTYVSRGLITSEQAPESKKARLYSADDVQRLRHRKRGGRKASSPETALPWPNPITSALTVAVDGHYFYRGRDVLHLARTRSIEEVASLLWTGNLDDGKAIFQSPLGALQTGFNDLQGLVKDLPKVETFQMLLSLGAARDAAAYDLRLESVVRSGVRILKLMTLAIAGTEPEESSIAGTLQRHWIPEHPERRRFIDFALILCSDLGLSPSAYTVRCVAASRSSPYSAVIAGLSILLGPRRGREFERAEALLEEVGQSQRARLVLEDRLRRGETLPGFANDAFPVGDARGEAALNLVVQECPNSSAAALGVALVEAGQDLLGERPNLALGLAVLARAMSLPRGATVALNALGRSVGWIAHAIEEYGEDRSFMALPVRYIGPRPETNIR